MSVIGGLRKHLNNLACTESVRVGLKTVEAGRYTDEEEDSPPTCIRSTNADLFNVDTVPKDKRD